VVRECLAGIAQDARHLVVVSAADGMLLSIHGDARIRRSAAASMNFTEGALGDESSAGTNAIGTALAADHALQIFAGEHFKEIAHAWTCLRRDRPRRRDAPALPAPRATGSPALALSKASLRRSSPPPMTTMCCEAWVQSPSGREDLAA